MSVARMRPRSSRNTRSTALALSDIDSIDASGP
jgi:hypothetical protein